MQDFRDAREGPLCKVNLTVSVTWCSASGFYRASVCLSNYQEYGVEWVGLQGKGTQVILVLMYCTFVALLIFM
jgi:hypothetical protein